VFLSDMASGPWVASELESHHESLYSAGEKELRIGIVASRSYLPFFPGDSDLTQAFTFTSLDEVARLSSFISSLIGQLHASGEEAKWWHSHALKWAVFQKSK